MSLTSCFVIQSRVLIIIRKLLRVRMCSLSLNLFLCVVCPLLWYRHVWSPEDESHWLWCCHFCFLVRYLVNLLDQLKFGAMIRGPPSFPLAPPSGQSFHLSSQTSLHLQDGWPWHFLNIFKVSRGWIMLPLVIPWLFLCSTMLTLAFSSQHHCA